MVKVGSLAVVRWRVSTGKQRREVPSGKSIRLHSRQKANHGRTMRTHCVNLVVQTVLLSGKTIGLDMGYILAAVVFLVTCKLRGRSAYQRPCLSFMFETQWCWVLLPQTYPDTRMGDNHTYAFTHTQTHTHA